MGTKTTCAALLALWAAPAVASDWWLVDFSGSKPSRVVVFVDRTAVARTENRVQAWVSNFNESPTGDPAIASSELLYEFDCSAHRYTLLKSVDWGRTREFIRSNTVSSKDLQSSRIAAGTIAESESKLLCQSDTSSAFPVAHFDQFTSGQSVLNILDHPDDSSKG